MGTYCTQVRDDDIHDNASNGELTIEQSESMFASAEVRRRVFDIGAQSVF